MFKFSVIIPVYNRPEELEELLASLLKQTVSNFEIIVVEDGSEKDSREVVGKYRKELAVKYFYKKNTGPGTTRNYGAERAQSDYFVFFDSDCIVPENYFEIVSQQLEKHYTDAFGGPDKAHPSFTPVQKAISYSMTSFFTTGGIRGGKKQMDAFHPRSFNMGISRKAFKKTGGFSTLRFGEDVDLSLRVIANGFKAQLISEAGVYHKRRTDFKKFFKQVYNSGIARIHLFLRHPKSLKLVHILPSVFLLGSIFIFIVSIFYPLFLLLFIIYALLLFFDALIQYKNGNVALLSVIASYIQLWAYGAGFLQSVWLRLIRKGKEFRAFEKNFYD